MVRVLSFLVFFSLSHSVFSSSNPKSDKVLKPEVIRPKEDPGEVSLKNESEEQEAQEERDLFKGVMVSPTMEESTALDLAWSFLVKIQAEPSKAYSVYCKYRKIFKEEQRKEFLRTLFRIRSFSKGLLDSDDEGFLKERFPNLFETEGQKKTKERLRENFFSKRESSRKNSS